MRPEGLEPPSSSLEDSCLIPLDHGRRLLVGATGFEPATFASQRRRSTKLSYAPIACGEIRYFNIEPLAGGLTAVPWWGEYPIVRMALAEYVPLILAVVWVALGILIGLAVDRVVLRRFSQSRTAGNSFWLTVSVDAVRGVAIVWGTIAGLYAALVTVNINPRLDVLISHVLQVLALASATFVAARFAAGSVTHYGGGVEKRLLSASLFASIAQIVVITFGALIILNSLGIAITPLITALGVGGLAIALALKDTLANLFSGVQIIASRQLRPGDYVKVESGFEGVVQDVNWRNTTIRELSNNLIVIPNEKLAQSIFTNYHLPETELTISVSIAAAYGSDLDEVERVALEAATAALDDLQLVTEERPYVRFREIGDSTVNLTVNIRTPEFADQFRARSYLIKRLHDGFNRGGLAPKPALVLLQQQPMTADVRRESRRGTIGGDDERLRNS
jgi:small-conductance mechanosensitive channel